MTEGRLAGKILAFSVPLMLTNLLQLLYNAADIIVIGRLCGQDPVAAVGSSSSFCALIVNVFLGLSVGVSVAVGKYIGQKRGNDVSETVHTAAILGILCGIAAGILGTLVSEPVLRLLKTPDAVMPLALIYLRIYLIGCPGNLLYNFLAAVLRANGDTKHPFVFLSISGVANVILNIVMVAVFRLDTAGVAIATIVSQYLSAAMMVIYMKNLDDSCKIDFGKLRLNSKKTLEIAKMGLPSGVQSSVFAISAMVIQSAVNSFGPAVMAGNTAAGSVDSFSYAIHNAFHYTSTSFVAQNFGAKKFDRIGKSVGICFVYAIISALISGGIIYLFANPLLSLYLPGNDAAIAAGTVRLKWLCLLYFLLAMMDVMSGSLRGLGCALVPTIISLIGSCGLRVLWIYTVLPKVHTLDVLYLSYPITWGATFIALFAAYLIVKSCLERKSLS